MKDSLKKSPRVPVPASGSVPENGTGRSGAASQQPAADESLSATAAEATKANEGDVDTDEDLPLPTHTKISGGDEEFQGRIVAALKTCYDPEIPVDIFELGLIYDVDIVEEGQVNLRMTLTSPMCPVAGSLPGEVEVKVKGVDGVSGAKVDLVWDPPWGMEMMSEVAKLKLQM